MRSRGVFGQGNNLREGRRPLIDNHGMF